MTRHGQLYCVKESSNQSLKYSVESYDKQLQVENTVTNQMSKQLKLFGEIVVLHIFLESASTNH
jgi:hypothetical protein